MFIQWFENIIVFGRAILSIFQHLKKKEKKKPTDISGFYHKCTSECAPYALASKVFAENCLRKSFASFFF